MKTYEGYGDEIEINQVRMDCAGKFAIIVAITQECILLNIRMAPQDNMIFQSVPINQKISFEQTTWSLGEF